MTSQVIILPPMTLTAILDHPAIPRLQAFALRDMGAREVEAADGSRAMRIHLDPLIHCPSLRDPFVDDVYALLLTSARPAAWPAVPHPLEESLALHLLNEVEAILLELPDLTGHDRLEIGAAFEWARAEKPSARSQRRRAPATPYESALLQTAAEIHDTIAPAIPRLDRKLASWQASLQASGLAAAVLRLGLQADLGMRLRLNSSGHTFLPRLAGRTRRCGLEGLLRTTHRELATFQEMGEAIHQGSVADASWLRVEALLGVHTTLLAGLPGQERAGHLRSEEMRIRSPIDGHVTVLELPGPAVEEAFAVFIAALDAALWRDVHPVVRAALAHVEFVRIHPFSDGNGRMARLLLQALLHEQGIPALPLEAAFTWNRASYIACVARAVQLGDPLPFVQHLLKAIDQSIRAGRHMVRVLKPHCAEIRESHRAFGADGRLATVAAPLAASMVLGPDPQMIGRTIHGVELSWWLSDSPLIDVVEAKTLAFTLSGYDADAAYSSPIARALTAAPLTLL
mgnify:CR=1 FL=1